MKRILIIFPLRINIILFLLFILPLKQNILSFNCFKDSNILNFIYLLRLKVLYLVNRVSVKINKSKLFSLLNYTGFLY